LKQPAIPEEGGPAVPKTAQKYLSIADAAQRLGVVPLTIRRAIRNGDLRGYRYGKKTIRVLADDVDALLRPIPSANPSGTHATGGEA
jgi:excisionase family DNA binding protein